MGAMRKSRLSSYKQGRLIEHFVAGMTTRTASSLCGVNRKTAAFLFSSSAWDHRPWTGGWERGHVWRRDRGGHFRFSSLPDQSLRTLCRQAEPHQRHRELLEPSKASYAKIQRCSQRALWVIFEGMWVAFQQSKATRSITTDKTVG